MKWITALLGLALLCHQLLLWGRLSFDELRFGTLCAAVLVALVWEKRQALAWESGPAFTLAGLALIAFALIRGFGQPGTLFATVAPVIWGLGFALLVSGFRGVGQFWKEAIVLAAVVLTPLIETLALDLAGVDFAPATAQTTAYLLRIAGWNASAHDVFVWLPTAWIVVSQGCSGLKTMYFLVGFALLVLLLFPVPGLARKLAVLAGATVIGFLVNAVRVAMLAVLTTPEHRDAFKFWHIQQGAMLFETVAVVAFLAFFCAVLPDRPARLLVTPASRK